jgi:hypothetical protein
MAVAILTITAAMWLHYGGVLLRDHRVNLERAEPWHPARLAAFIASRVPADAAVLTDLGPTLAYHLPRRVLFDTPLEDFYPADLTPAEATRQMAEWNVRAIATRRSAADWFTAVEVPADAQGAFTEVPTGGPVTLMMVETERLTR